MLTQVKSRKYKSETVLPFYDTATLTSKEKASLVEVPMTTMTHGAVKLQI